MFVVLFDIDGTLIHTGGAGLAALHSAVREEFDVVEPADISLSGRTDRGIARDLFRAHGVAETEENWLRFRRSYLAHLERHLPQRKGAVLPGVSNLVARLLGEPNVAVGLLTGNVRDGARIKLSYYQLHQYFAFGGFGDHHHLRDDVAREALRSSQEFCAGKTIHPDRVWVIGDTPLDVRCARAIGAKVVAVATGTHPREELETTAADLVVDSLEEQGLFERLIGV